MSRFDPLATTLLACAVALVAVAIAAHDTARTLLWAGVGICFVAGVVAFVVGRPARPRLMFAEPTVETRVVGVRVIGSIPTSSIPVTGANLEDPSSREPPPTPPPQVIAYTSASTHFEPGDRAAWCVYAHVRNQPKRGATQAASVRAQITFQNLAGEQIATIAGRWAHYVQGTDVEPTQKPPVTDLPANGGSFKLDVAIKHYGDSECFGFNDFSRFSTTDLRDVRLGAGPVAVRVDAIGANVSASETYVLTANGPDERPTLVRRDSGHQLDTPIPEA